MVSTAVCLTWALVVVGAIARNRVWGTWLLTWLAHFLWAAGSDAFLAQPLVVQMLPNRLMLLPLLVDNVLCESHETAEQGKNLPAHW